MDKVKFFVPVILAALTITFLMPSMQPQISKASTCSASASAGGAQRAHTNLIMRVPPPTITSPGGCASAGGAIGGPFGGSAARSVGGNPSACNSVSTSGGGFGSDSGSSVSCSPRQMLK